MCTFEELEKMGSEQAWLKLKKIGRSACVNRLLALEGAIKGVHKSLIDEQRKMELKNFLKL
nr:MULTISPECIES: TfoX/Sxy family DNA transformation protein [unclassified Enterococcus]